MGWDTITGTVLADNLVLSDLPWVTRTVTIASGTIVRGCVVGMITISGEFVACDHTAIDGSENPRGVLLEDCDASAATVDVGIYSTGYFYGDGLTFGGTSVLADLREAMELNGLHVRD
jgi:hypothetical protein